MRLAYTWEVGSMDFYYSRAVFAGEGAWIM